MDEETRLCRQCGQQKPISEYKIDKRVAEGITQACKACLLTNRILRSGDQYQTNEQNETIKRCLVCTVSKPLSQYIKDARSSDGYQRACAECRNGARREAYVTGNGKEAMRRGHLFRTYGITYEQFEDMKAAQENRCASCGEFETSRGAGGGEKELAVDHCHDTGKVRALLCTACNAGIGHFRDDQERIRKALAYLQKHQD